MLETREWVFRVSCVVDPGESVFVTGSCDILGSWNPQCLVPLTMEGSHELQEKDCETIWRVTLHLPCHEIEYRFCVCMAMQKSKNEVIYAVKRWETDLHPRILPSSDGDTSDPETILSFGYVSNLNKLDQGWLINESALFLKLCRSNVHNDPIVLWKKKHKDKKCYLKVTPINITKMNSIDSLLDFPTDESTEVELVELRMKSKSLLPVVEVSVLKEGATEFRYQDQFGVLCNDEEFIVFQCRLADQSTIGFLFDYYIEVEENEAPKYIGYSFVLPSSFKDSYGVSSLPITSPKHIPMGQLTVSYMLVHPLEDYKCNMRVSYARHWKESWKGLEVGHRGAGNSYHSQTKNCANIRENTIASLKHACENGADMVEFDVQLSKDLVPVIYHDFHACIALKYRREPLKTDLMEIPIKDLTLAQLQALTVYHKTEKGSSRFSDHDSDDHQPFPTLKDALNDVPNTCAFNIEIKWTMRLKDGSYELQHPFELNRFLDSILKVVLQSTSPRKIIFSCFHPDICTIIRLKQNLYPVLFLTQGESKTWPGYDDCRTKSIRNAVLYASSANILGINVNTEDLLRDSTQLQVAFDHSLVAFCWGDQNSDRETIRLLKTLGLHGIIYDKIDVYNSKSKKSSVFLCDDKETCRCFPSSCKERVNKDGTKYLSPFPSSGEISLTPSSEKLSTSEEAAAAPPTAKRISSEEAFSAKRPKNESPNTGGGSPTSFCGILSLS